MKSIIVQELTQTSSACPSQWVGKTIDGLPVFIHYRFGRGYISVLQKEVFHWEALDKLDGVISYTELKTIIPQYITLPEYFT